MELENDSFYEYHDLVKDLKVSITMDYGHLLMVKESPQEFYERYAEQIKEIHYHGVIGEKGHVSPDERQLNDFIKFYDRNFEKDIPVCIELFELEDTKKVFERLKRR
jgi:sugar phosphate isomerase/epimerase